MLLPADLPFSYFRISAFNTVTLTRLANFESNVNHIVTRSEFRWTMKSAIFSVTFLTRYLFARSLGETGVPNLSSEKEKENRID